MKSEKGGTLGGVWCEVCRIRPAATILECHYLCGGCALRALLKASDLRAEDVGVVIDLRERPAVKGDPSQLPAGDPWQLPEP